MSQNPQKPIQFLGLTIKRPDFMTALSAGLLTTIFFLIFSVVLPPESGAHAAGRWASIFGALMLNRMGVQPFDSLSAAGLSIVTIVVSGIVGTVAYVMVTTTLGV